MKRSFHEFDGRIPKALLERFPAKAEHLQRIADMEEEIETRWACFRRTALEENCEPKVKPKMLRVYIRHSFIPSTPEERSYFLLTVEGRVLDGTPVEMAPLGRFFDEISVVPERKHNIDNMAFEWTKEKFAAGIRAQCVRFKMYCDRTLPVTIRLVRSDYAVKRYEMSSGLRQLFPKLALDPTEDDVLGALWEYIKTYDLCPDKTSVTCDEKLKRITEEDIVSLSSLKAVVVAHLFPCKAVEVDYTLSTTSFNDDGLTEKRYGTGAYSKSGGKCFDLNVHVVDSECHKILDILNRGSKKEENMQAEFDKVQTRSAFLIKSMHRCEREIQSLHALTAAPVSLALLQPPKAPSSPTGMLHTHLPAHFHDTHSSEMHGLGHFLDVSCDDMFSSSKFEWVTKAAYASASM